CDAARPGLVRVEEAPDAELLAVAQEPQELACMRAACNEHDVGHTRLHERLDRVADHRPVVDRQEMLVGDLGQRMQPAACAAGEDYALHHVGILHQSITARLGLDGRAAARAARSARRRRFAGTSGIPRTPTHTGSRGGRGPSPALGAILPRRLLVVGWRQLASRLLTGPPVAVEWTDLGAGRPAGCRLEQ